MSNLTPVNNTANAPKPEPIGSVIAVAVQALNAIASEASQAASRLLQLAPITLPNKPPAPAPSPLRAAAAMVPAAAPAAPNGPTAQNGQMTPGQVLHPGDALRSPSGNYMFVMQTDGNLVLYSGSCALWASGTNGKPVAVCIMQGDGNLVLYNAAGQALWASNTSGKAGAHLVVQDDGNVVIYQTNGKPAWATNTVHTIGNATMVYRGRLKRWTNVPFAGTKGNDCILVKLPAGATLKSVHLGAFNSIDLDPNANSPVGTQVGDSNSGARVTKITSGTGYVAVGTHWWFNGFFDAEYSIEVWVTGPTAYPVEDNGTIVSLNMDSQILGELGTWIDTTGAKVGEAILEFLEDFFGSGDNSTDDGTASSAVEDGTAQVYANPNGD